MTRASEIYLVRHGETEWNASGRFQGGLDSALTARGIEQAEACGRRLAALVTHDDVIHSSPLGRARQTTAILQAFTRSPRIAFDDRLAEVSIGSRDGLTHVDIDACWPGLLDGATHFDWFFRSPDGESFEAAAKRVQSWLDGLDGTVIAVSHGLLGRILRGVYLGLSRDDALRLPVPQDAIWRLAGGQMTQIDT